MQLDIDVHALKHGLSEREIRHAWDNTIRKQHRPSPNENYIVAIGFTQSGKSIQMVGVQNAYGTLIFHAMEPPQVNVLKELGLAR